MRMFLGILALASGAAAGLYLYVTPSDFPVALFSAPQADVPKYVLAPVQRGDITKVVTASGALSAITTVTLSSEVSGQMLRILADYNAEVRKGDVIAEINPLRFEIAVEQAQSESAMAEANVAIQQNLYSKAVLDLTSAKYVVESARFITERKRIALDEAKRDVERKRTLTSSGNISQVDLLKTQAVFDMATQELKGAEADERTKDSVAKAAEASLRASGAQVAHAAALARQKRTVLKAAMTDLERTKIRSPIDGVVIGRTIEEGQMVTVYLQTQNLFTVAQDLKEMQIKISIDEADIGHIKVGQPVLYTVDAFPGREFQGEIKQVRKDSQEKQNVITYIVIASAPNPDKMLLPGMTANARIIIDERTDVAKVPLAALRFAPAGNPSPGAVWTLDGNQYPKPVPVKVGLSDGKMIEVTSAQPVAWVIVGVNQTVRPPTVMKRIIGSI